jgi:hypothetical protein
MRSKEGFLADALKNFEAKNSKNEIIAKATDVTISPAEVDVPIPDGTIKKGYSTILKDITMTLKLYGVLCAEHSCYFNDTVDLKLGSGSFYMQSDKTYISDGKIMSITYDTPGADN